MPVSLKGRILPVAIMFSALLGADSLAEPSGVYQQDFAAKFSLKAHGTVIGKTEWSLTTNDANELIYKSESKAAGIAALITNDHIVERSVWRREPQGLLPHTYKYDRSGGKREKRVAVAFDWKNGLARNTAKGETWSMPVPEGTLDKLGYVIVMMHDLNTGKRDLQYQIADGGKLKLYRFKAIGEESLKTPFGVLSTVIMRRIRDDKRETTYWCATQYRYLPIKVEHREKDGSVITLYIESLRGIPRS